MTKRKFYYEKIEKINKNETFVLLEEFDNLYAISNYGRLVSFKHKKPRVLKIGINGSDYPSTTICHTDGKRQTVNIHKLVAKVFVKNDNPTINTVVNHKDGHKDNNYYGNLEWITQSENIQHAIKLGIIKSEKRNRKYYNDVLYRNRKKILKFLKEGILNCREIAKILNIKPSYVYKHKNALVKQGKFSKKLSNNKLSELDVLNIRMRYSEFNIFTPEDSIYNFYKMIAEKYSVHITTIYSICKRITWKNI